MELLPVCREIEAALTAAGIRSTLDARALNPPAVWIVPTAADTFTLADDMTVTVDLLLVVGESGTESRNLAALDALLDPVAAALAAFAAFESLAVTMLETAAGPLPAYRLTVKIVT